MTLFENFMTLIVLGFKSVRALELTIFERNSILKFMKPYLTALLLSFFEDFRVLKISINYEFRILPLKFKSLPLKLYYMIVAPPSCNYENFTFK